MLPWLAVSVKEEITQQQKISEQRLINLNSVNIADFVESIRRTRRPDKYYFKVVFCRPVALTVERRTPNPGVGGSNPSWPANVMLIIKLLPIIQVVV